jgi:hypothetical protein
VDDPYQFSIQLYINRRPTQTNPFCPGDSTSLKGYEGTGLPGQNTHAFQAVIFAQRSLVLPPQVAEAKIRVCQRLSSERSERAVNKNRLELLLRQRRMTDYGIQGIGQSQKKLPVV